MNRPPMEATEPMKQGIGDTAHISPPDIAISLPDISPRDTPEPLTPARNEPPTNDTPEPLNPARE